VASHQIKLRGAARSSRFRLSSGCSHGDNLPSLQSIM
jgi:hypothetical protein